MNRRQGGRLGIGRFRPCREIGERGIGLPDYAPGLGGQNTTQRLRGLFAACDRGAIILPRLKGAGGDDRPDQRHASDNDVPANGARGHHDYLALLAAAAAASERR